MALTWMITRVSEPLMKYLIFVIILVPTFGVAQITKFKTNYIIDNNNEAKLDAEVTINGNYVSVLSDEAGKAFWIAGSVDSLDNKTLNGVVWYRVKESGGYVSYSTYKGGKTFGVITSSGVMYYFAYKPD